MKLDNHKQKELILHLASTTHIAGSYREVREATKAIEELIENVIGAEIESESIEPQPED